MPLIRSGSKEAIQTNIREMVRAGHPQRQAVAAALRTADKYRKKYAEGGAPASGPPASVKFPDDEDTARSTRYDLSYGDPSAGFLNPGGAKINDVPANLATRALNSDQLEKYSKQVPNTPVLADQLHRAWLATRQSPVAALGFDPHHMYSSARSGPGWTVAGVNNPDTDTMWRNRAYDSTAVHESIHRGIGMLKKAGRFPSGSLSGETAVRGLMQKYYGDVEAGRGKEGDREIAGAKEYYGRRYNSEQLDEIEAAAARLIAERTPGGPRASGGRVTTYAEGGDVDDNTQEPPEKEPPADTFADRWGDMPSNRVRREEPNPARAMRQMAATQGFNQRAGEIGQRWLDDYYKVPGDILKGKYTPQPADPSLWSEYDQEARDRGAERLQELGPMIALSGVGASPAMANRAAGVALSPKGSARTLEGGDVPSLQDPGPPAAAPRAGSLEEAALNSYLQHSEPPSVTSRSPQERQLASEDYNRRMEEAADTAGLTGDKRAEFLDTGFVSAPGQSSVQARAAVKVGDQVYTGTIHADAYEKALAEHGEKKADTVENGWLLDDGRFLTADQLADQGLTARRQQVAEPPAASAAPQQERVEGADPADSVLSTLSADPKWKGKWKDDADEDRVWHHMRESYPGMADAQLQTIANEIKDRLKNGEFWHGTTRGRFTTFNEPTEKNDVLGPAIYLSRHKGGAEFYGPGRGGDLLGPFHVRGNIVKPETMVPWEPGGQKMVPAINVLDKLKGQLDTGHREPWGNGMTPAQYTREFMKRRGIAGYDSGLGLEVAVYDPANIRSGFDPAPEAKQAQGKVGPPTRKRGGRIDRSKDVPLLAASNKKGGKTYIDKRIPKYIHAGKKLNTSKYLSIHEQTERSLMEKEKMNYADAHKKATAAERAAVEKDGGDWKRYSEIMSGYVNETEHEKNAKMPKDIYMKPYKQEGKAIAAMRTAKKLASGGDAGYFEHSAFRQLARPGMIHSPIPGRTDKIPMRVKGGSYVIPADVVSGAGQGNSMAGASALNRLFKAGPYGAGASRIATPNINYGHPAGSHLGFRPVRALADGGDDGAGDDGGGAGDGNSGTADIVTAGGEYLVAPETVKRLGGGDMGHGHDILDEFVLHTRKSLVKTLKKLPGPKRS